MINEEFIKERLSEPSTWRGLVRIATAAASAIGLTISPDVGVAIMVIGITIVGAIGTLTDDVPKAARLPDTTRLSAPVKQGDAWTWFATRNGQSMSGSASTEHSAREALVNALVILTSCASK